MRFFAVATLLLGSVAFAAPAEEKTKDTCCCCDISKPAIACFKDVKPEDCICAAVMCPKDAPTVWPKSTPLPTAVAKREEKTPAAGPPCCCCDASKDAIVCTVRAEGEDNSCVCADVMCPKDAPTLTVHSGPKKTGN